MSAARDTHQHLIDHMIARIWHGWTARQNAAAYDRLLKQEVFPAIEAMRVRGYLGIELLRRDIEEEVEFVTIMWFRSIEAVKEFAGDDYAVANVPEKARSILTRYDARSVHYRVSKPGAFDEFRAHAGHWY